MVEKLRQTEQQFLDAVLEYAAIYGYMRAHFRPAQTSQGWRTAVQGDVGFPDLVLVNGEKQKVVFAELKAENGELSPEQYLWIKEIQETGRQAYVWTPDDWPEIEKVLA